MPTVGRRCSMHTSAGHMCAQLASMSPTSPAPRDTPPVCVHGAQSRTESRAEPCRCRCRGKVKSPAPRAPHLICFRFSLTASTPPRKRTVCAGRARLKTWPQHYSVYLSNVGACLSHRKCFPHRMQRSIPAHIRPYILHMSNHRGQVDGFLRELIFAERPL